MLCAGVGALIAKLSEKWPARFGPEFSPAGIAAMIAFAAICFIPVVMFPPAWLGWLAGTWLAISPYSHPGEHCPVSISPEQAREINSLLDEVEGGHLYYILPHLLAR